MSTVFTKAIKNGKLKATEMEIGATVSGTVKELREGRFGSNLVLEVQGREVEVYPSGNLKYAIKDGKITVGAFTTITREADVPTKSGYITSRFNINQSQQQPNVIVKTDANATANSTKPSVQDQLAAIRNSGKN